MRPPFVGKTLWFTFTLLYSPTLFVGGFLFPSLAHNTWIHGACSAERTISRLAMGTEDKDEEGINMDMTFLAQRINELKSTEEKAGDALASGLSGRVKELQASQEMEQQLETGRVSLPVISFDALLPGQRLQGSTQDSSFCCFLRDLGMGGWFVMTSLELKSRKIRRNGVLCKLEGIDAFNNKNDPSNNRIPTAVDFSIVGTRRCRVVGPSSAMTMRIGRWRRGYDPNGEESMLGWGDERFLDAAEDMADLQVDTSMNDATPLDSTEWSLVDIQCADLDDPNKVVDDATLQKAESLTPLIDEWYELASTIQTYDNTDVTATRRIQSGRPGLYVDPLKLLERVLADLGPRPPVSQPTALAFWAAALINPLPALGVSLEIRGRILEAPSVQRRLEILELGLVRSIQNLKGERPL